MSSLRLNIQDLVSIGVFASLARAGSLLIALAGGGMNPLTMILRNLFMVVLLSSLIVKVGKPWTLTLANITGMLISALILGQSLATIPLIFLASLIAEAFLWLTSRRYTLTLALILGVFVSELALKIVNALSYYLMYREQPTLSMIMFTMMIMLGISTFGSFLGIFVSAGFIKELRRASLIFR